MSLPDTVQASHCQVICLAVLFASPSAWLGRRMALTSNYFCGLRCEGDCWVMYARMCKFGNSGFPGPFDSVASKHRWQMWG